MLSSSNYYDLTIFSQTLLLEYHIPQLYFHHLHLTIASWLLSLDCHYPNIVTHLSSFDRCLLVTIIWLTLFDRCHYNALFLISIIVTWTQTTTINIIILFSPIWGERNTIILCKCWLFFFNHMIPHFSLQIFYVKILIYHIKYSFIYL